MRKMSLLKDFEASHFHQSAAAISLEQCELPQTLEKLDLSNTNLAGSRLPESWNDLGSLYLSRAQFYVCRDDREHADLVHGRGKRPGVWQGGVRAGMQWS